MRSNAMAAQCYQGTNDMPGGNNFDDAIRQAMFMADPNNMPDPKQGYATGKPGTIYDEGQMIPEMDPNSQLRREVTRPWNKQGDDKGAVPMPLPSYVPSVDDQKELRPMLPGRENDPNDYELKHLSPMMQMLRTLGIAPKGHDV